ncbi:hypothetical protein ACTPOE_01150 [Castellaniella sp. WN]
MNAPDYRMNVAPSSHVEMTDIAHVSQNKFKIGPGIQTTVNTIAFESSQSIDLKRSHE